MTQYCVTLGRKNEKTCKSFVDEAGDYLITSLLNP